MPTWIPSLADAGGWAVVLAIGFALGAGFMRGWIVPGWIYRNEVEWRDRMTAAMEKLTDAAFPRRGGPGAP